MTLIIILMISVMETMKMYKVLLEMIKPIVIKHVLFQMNLSLTLIKGSKWITVIKLILYV